MAIIVTETIRNLKCDIHCNERGQFRIVPYLDTATAAETLDDQPIIAAGYNLMDVRTKADKRLRSSKRVRVAVPYTTRDFKQATAIGCHATTRQYLIVIDDGTLRGQSGRLESFNARRQFKPHLTSKALEHRKRLEVLKTSVEDKISKWENRYAFDVGQAVDAAIREQESPDSNA